MTDDNTARYRSNDPFSSRAVGPDGHGSDPLAELARLIGQTDPFAGRETHTPAPHDYQDHRYDEPAPRQEQLPYEDPVRYDDAASLNEPTSYGQAAAYTPRHDAAYETEAAPLPDWAKPSEPASDPFAALAQQVAAAEPADLDRLRAAEPPPAFLSEFKFPIPPPQRSDVDADVMDEELRQLADFRPPPPADVGSLPRSFTSDSSPPPHVDEFYDDVPQGGRRRGLVTVMFVLCLAVVGTGAAFGYRTWVSNSSSSKPPPVIRASAEPAKVAPPQAADPAANKISYDRFADRGQNEKVVPREEKPIDLKDAARAGVAPRPMPPGATSPVFPPPAPAATAAGNPPSVLTEPKRVRTVPIRPDAPDVSPVRAQVGQQVAQMAAPIPAQAAPARAAAQPANAPMNLANPVAPPPQARASAARPAPAAANAPLSLSPDSNLPPPAAAAPARAAPTRVASAPAGNGNGSYLVQVSSQRSEADAQAAFRNLKSRYSSVLGDRQPVIRRADLAGKGTYYRAMVGPFSTRDQAIQLCSSLKAAGGDCVVQAN